MPAHFQVSPSFVFILGTFEIDLLIYCFIQRQNDGRVCAYAGGREWGKEGDQSQETETHRFEPLFSTFLCAWTGSWIAIIETGTWTCTLIWDAEITSSGLIPNNIIPACFCNNFILDSCVLMLVAYLLLI